MFNKFKTLSTIAKIKYAAVIFLTTTVCAAGVYYVSVNPTENKAPGSSGTEVISSIPDESEDEPQNSEVEPNEDKEVKEEAEPESTPKKETVKPTEKPVATQKPTETPVATAKPTPEPTPAPTEKPAATPVPKCATCGSEGHTVHPAQCVVCGSEQHINHPTPVETQDTQKPAITPTPTEPPVNNVEHYHGNGSDGGQCPACGLVYSPTLDFSGPGNTDELSPDGWE